MGGLSLRNLQNHLHGNCWDCRALLLSHHSVSQVGPLLPSFSAVSHTFAAEGVRNPFKGGSKIEAIDEALKSLKSPDSPCSNYLFPGPSYEYTRAKAMHETKNSIF